MSILNKIDKYLNEEQEKKDSVKEKLYKFFKDNKNPPDKKVHGLAEKLGIDPDDLESEIYSILSSFMSNGRFNEKGKGEDSYPEDEIKMGIKVEQEHTTDLDMAKRIALDHLSEFPDYYTRLLKMENEAKKELGEAVVTDRANSLKGLQKQLSFETNRQKSLKDPKQKEMGQKRIETIKKNIETIKNSMK
mgnify:CR=1 FL=1